MIAQMVATGSLIKLLFGLPYTWSVVVVGSVMLVYVLFGGMLATTWVQVVKAALLMGGGILLAFLVLTHLDMNPLKLFAARSEKYGTKVLQPGSKVVSGQWDAISLGLGLMFGTAAMPHVLMRAYTVKDAKAARLSILYATGLIGVFHLMVFIIGFGAMVLDGADGVAKAGGGGNMAAPLLAEVLGGTPFLGVISAVAFATILAVVAGLTLSGAAALAHDLWGHVVKRGNVEEKQQLRIARYATIGLAVLAILLGLLFKGQNVAFMVGLAFFHRVVEVITNGLLKGISFGKVVVAVTRMARETREPLGFVDVRFGTPLTPSLFAVGDRVTRPAIFIGGFSDDLKVNRFEIGDLLF